MPAIRPLPPIDILNSCFQLDAGCLSGLRWKDRPREHFNSGTGYNRFKTAYAGKMAGNMVSPNRSGGALWRVCLDGRPLIVHRIIYAMAHGGFDESLEVDHIDRNALNNDLGNLRLATRSQNASNKSLSSANSSGVRGVVWCKRTSMWMAQIGVNRKCIFLGRYKNKEDAIKAREKASKKLHQDFRGGLTHDECAESINQKLTFLKAAESAKPKKMKDVRPWEALGICKSSWYNWRIAGRIPRDAGATWTPEQSQSA